MDFNKIIQRVRPSDEERKRVNNIINKVKGILESNGLEVFIGGSFGKDTWVSGDFDIDLFVLFKNEENISDILESILKKENLDYIRIKGSRDYFKVFFENYEFEIIPILKINKVEEAKNITDLSPFHVKYVLEHTDEKMRDEIRLAKVFMKSIGVYGAESYIKGFSGYSVELLIIYYKTFENLIKNSVNWKPKVFIDLEGYYKDIKDAIKALGRDKTKSPIILIDPVNKIRNALASLSIQKFSEFIFYSNLFLEDEDKEKYFQKRKVNINELIEYAKKYNVSLLEVEGIGKGSSKDIKNTKLLKFFENIVRSIRFWGFNILNYYIFFDGEKGYLYVMFYPKKLPNYEVRRGPFVWERNNLLNFLRLHKGEEIFVKNSRVYSITKRKVTNLNEIIERIVKEGVEDKVERFNYKLYLIDG